MESDKRRRQAGFTLVELMVVVVIIGILAGVVVVNYAGRTSAAYESRVQADFKAIEDAIQFFHMDAHRYPENLDELMLGSDIEDWNGPYLKKPPMDPWGEIYIYEYTGEEPLPYEIKTFGADRTEGGEGDDKDYSNLDYLKEEGFGG